MNSEDQFLQGLLELQYGEKVENKLKNLAKNIPWAINWPEDNTSFWNAEAFMWNNKIKKETRELIRQELFFLNKRNLDLGCGAYSYIPSVGFDFSEKMLKFNENCKEKVIGDLEKPLPFIDKFDSVTAIFILNYVTNYKQLFSEIKKLLKNDGTFIMILSNKPVNKWQKQKQVNSFLKEEWLNILNDYFKVEFYEKKGLLFYRCRKPY